MEVSGGKTSMRISLDIRPLFFHTLFKLVRVPVVIYVEIFQAVEVQGDGLLPKQFLDLGFDGVVRWKSPPSEVFFQFSKRVNAQGGPGQVCTVGGVRSRNGFGSRTSPSIARAWKIS
jgi:hypothetical protein